MTFSDLVSFTLAALRGYKLRSGLTLLAMAIGVGAVILLTALAEGARRYVEGEFSSLGKNLLIILPGRSETKGGPPPLLGETPRDLTLDDALSLKRMSAVAKVAPLSFGTAPVSWGSRDREIPILGTTAEMLEVRHLKMASGRFLPDTDPHRALPVCVIGSKVKDQLLGGRSPLGEWIRIGDRRFQVIGMLSSRGRSLGLDVDDMVVIPVASALMLFNSPSLFRVMVEARAHEEIPAAKRQILEELRHRHDGEDDITVITQDAVLSTFNKIFEALTLSVGGIAAISLLVAGILIMNVLLVSVTERTGEIGILKALGASQRKIQMLFLTEAICLAVAGGFLGLGAGEAGVWALQTIYPSFPVTPPAWSPPAAMALALAAGAFFGAMPASRAARLDPVAALSRR
ncbi:MAG: ABC transporter permease [Planctomycetes bacterium]|nr:ABC transporter permease [Planctomycetota bacterium]